MGSASIWTAALLRALQRITSASANACKQHRSGQLHIIGLPADGDVRCSYLQGNGVLLAYSYAGGPLEAIHPSRYNVLVQPERALPVTLPLLHTPGENSEDLAYQNRYGEYWAHENQCSGG